MSIRKIDTALSTIRSVFDEEGNYIPSGNYFFSTKEYVNGNFTGKMTRDGLNFGEFTLSPRKLVKMMAVAQSRLAKIANLNNQEGMPNYPCPSTMTHSSPEKCSICLEDLTTYNKKSLTCKHAFHMTCVNTWLREQNNCPLCRASQVTVNELRNTTSLYERLRARDYSEGRNRTVVFPGSMGSSGSSGSRGSRK